MSEPKEVQEDLSIADRAAKVKSAMDEYQALDHEDMVSSSLRPQRRAAVADSRPDWRNDGHCQRVQTC